MFSTHFKHKNTPMVWTMLKTVENHVKYFKVCWKPCWKFQGLGHTAEKGMTWPWRDLLKTYFTELIQLKYKLILWIKTMGCCGLACVVWLKSCEFLKRKSVLIVGNSSMMCLLRKFLNLTSMTILQEKWTFKMCYRFLVVRFFEKGSGLQTCIYILPFCYEMTITCFQIPSGILF